MDREDALSLRISLALRAVNGDTWLVVGQEQRARVPIK
jgi:hypothetical protein